ALHLALLAAGVGPGDEVIVPSFTFAATANAVRLAGAEPVFVDIDRATFCVEVEAVGAAITGRTAAIMPVHLYGDPAPLHALKAMAAAHVALLVEDADHVLCAALDGRYVGSWGRVAACAVYRA